MNQSVDTGSLSGVPLFRRLPRDDLLRLAASAHRRAFAAGASVAVAGQPGEAVYVVLEGSVKATVLRPDGTEVILAVLGPGEVVGGMSLADGRVLVGGDGRIAVHDGEALARRAR